MPYDKSLPYSCPCCGYWNGDMKYDYYRHIKKEPLIIDEHPRNAVREFLYANGGRDEVTVRYYSVTNNYMFTNKYGYSIELRAKLKPCDLNKTYTLEELCGEEE